MPDMPIPIPPEPEQKCGNCFFYKLKAGERGEWTGPWVCKSPKANPDKKDPKDGNVNMYNRPACRYWEW